MRSYEEYVHLVNDNLIKTLQRIGDIPAVLLQAMSYSLQAGGKRLRPVLLLMSCQMLNGNVEEAIPFACALEMIHTYSLIHDDLPAMDNDDLRRGRPTNHKVFGEDIAILAGDGLLNAAMQIMLKASCSFTDNRGCRAAEVIARRCGVTGMIAGQIMDVTGEGTEVTEDKVSYIHQHKTADLLTAPVEAGLILAGAKDEQIAHGTSYGQNMGFAFQIIDDLLDVIGDATILGKKTGMDAQLGKLTWVTLRGTEGAKSDARHYTQMAVDSIRQLNVNTDCLVKLAEDALVRVV